MQQEFKSSRGTAITTQASWVAAICLTSSSSGTGKNNSFYYKERLNKVILQLAINSIPSVSLRACMNIFASSLTLFVVLARFKRKEQVLLRMHAFLQSLIFCYLKISFSSMMGRQLTFLGNQTAPIWRIRRMCRKRCFCYRKAFHNNYVYWRVCSFTICIS